MPESPTPQTSVLDVAVRNELELLSRLERVLRDETSALDRFDVAELETTRLAKDAIDKEIRRIAEQRPPLSGAVDPSLRTAYLSTCERVGEMARRNQTRLQACLDCVQQFLHTATGQQTGDSYAPARQNRYQRTANIAPVLTSSVE